jgi:hypothetical protein
MKIIYKVFDKIIHIIKQRIEIRPIAEFQSALAFEDSQKFIYEKSGLRTMTFIDHWDLRTYCLKEMPSVGEVLEFGVFKAKSINFMAKYLSDLDDERKIVGFDSFRGFSEEWSGVDRKYEKEFFDQSGVLPKVESNVELVDGFIEDTLPSFIERRELDTVAFVHIDTDTYTPAKVALELLKPYLRKGSIILFDELCGYPNWRSHEYKALTEVLNANEYEFLGFAQSHPRAQLIKAAIRIL